MSQTTPPRRERRPSLSITGRVDVTGRVEAKKPLLGFEIANAKIGSKLLQVTRRHFLLATELLKEIGLVPPQELVLMRLSDCGQCSHTEMVRFFGRDRSTITKTLQAMERAGLIDKRPSETDGRAVVISLTDRGKALHPKVIEIWADLERRTTAHLSERQLQTLMRAFDTMLESLSP